MDLVKVDTAHFDSDWAVGKDIHCYGEENLLISKNWYLSD